MSPKFKNIFLSIKSNHWKQLFLIHFTLFFILSISINAQNYNFKKYRNLINKARLASYNKNYKLEKKIYLKCFKYGNNNLPDYSDLESYAICLLNNKDTLNAIKTMEKVFVKIDLTLYNSNFLLEKLSYNDSLILTSRFPYYKKVYEDQRDKNQPYWRKIHELELKDQEVRQLKNQIPDNEFNKLLKKTDSINHLELYNLVTKEGASPFCFLLYHLYGENEKYYTFYDSILKMKVFSGECPPEAYALWVDRQKVYVLGEPKQIYGYFNVSTNNYDFYPIIDIENVDKRRAEIGLCTLKEFAKINGIILPKDYIKKQTYN